MTTPKTARDQSSSHGILPAQPRSSRLSRLEELRQACLCILRDNCRGQTRLEFKISPYVAELHGMKIQLFTPDFWLKAYSVRDEYLWALLASLQDSIDFRHGLNVWFGPNVLYAKKVMNIEWGLDGQIVIRSFRRGPWEQILLTAAETGAGKKAA